MCQLCATLPVPPGLRGATHVGRDELGSEVAQVAGFCPPFRISGFMSSQVSGWGVVVLQYQRSAHQPEGFRLVGEARWSTNMAHAHSTAVILVSEA